ncbi:hypothetical protein ACIPZ8_14665 [Pseudomonas sp. NPDC089422]
MDWFELMRLIWRFGCVVAKVVGVLRAIAWLLDRWNDDDKS